MQSSDATLQGIRVSLRIQLTQPPEWRYDASGAEVMQLRGTVLDDQARHPPAVVRFGGQRRAELRKWAGVGKHLSVEGQLEVKYWKTDDGKPHVALLIDAQHIFPLSDVADNSQIGVYALSQESTRGHRTRTPRGGRDAAALMRLSLEQADA